MFKPVFPYKGNQLILTSDRVTIYSKNDAVFIFGKEAVSISSVKTINLDANEKILINCTKIELGSKAEIEGEPVILGDKLNSQLKGLIDGLTTSAILMKQVSAGNLGVSMEVIRQAADILYDACEEANAYITSKTTLSKNTFTR
jgi:hypothetical protein